jgi:anti-sigma regulatory factor (Ser/Thr protein kinase)
MSQVTRSAPAADGIYGPLLRIRIRPRAKDVGRARHWFRSCLGEVPADDAEAAEAVFAEVASNAVRHGRGRVTITVLFLGDTAHCAVRDFGLRKPKLSPPWRPDLEHGRGMVIVTALADSWGIHRHLLGKTVWFDVSVPARPPAPALAAPAPASAALPASARHAPAPSSERLPATARGRVAGRSGSARPDPG